MQERSTGGSHDDMSADPNPMEADQKERHNDSQSSTKEALSLRAKKFHNAQEHLEGPQDSMEEYLHRRHLKTDQSLEKVHQGGRVKHPDVTGNIQLPSDASTKQHQRSWVNFHFPPDRILSRV